MQGWWRLAACRNLPLEVVDDLFFAKPNANSKHKKAKAICRGCPVRRDCFDEAVRLDTDGVFGGATHEERIMMKALLDSMEQSQDQAS